MMVRPPPSQEAGGRSIRKAADQERHEKGGGLQG
jgi:hypothetical protein